MNPRIAVCVLALACGGKVTSETGDSSTTGSPTGGTAPVDDGVTGLWTGSCVGTVTTGVEATTTGSLDLVEADDGSVTGVFEYVSNVTKNKAVIDSLEASSQVEGQHTDDVLSLDLVSATTVGGKTTDVGTVTLDLKVDVDTLDGEMVSGNGVVTLTAACSFTRE